jgi:diguanylate cyclase (GGDEF)-like protein
VAVDRIDRCPAIRRATIYSVDDLSDELAFRCPAHPALQGAMACVPLLAMGQPIGVIHLEAERPFAPDILTLAGRIAEQVGVAIANTRRIRTMESLAMTDGLTGLRNPRFFDGHLEQELAAAARDSQPVSVIMLDLDHFKTFNDQHGHPAGDEALRVLGRVLRASIRASDVAARYGGEEFVVALHHTGLEGAALVAEKLRHAISAAIVEIAPGRFARITASFGVASTERQDADLRGLLAAADAALYEAKTSGRNQIRIAGDPAGAPTGQHRPVESAPGDDHDPRAGATRPAPTPIAQRRRPEAGARPA